MLNHKAQDIFFFPFELLKNIKSKTKITHSTDMAISPLLTWLFSHLYFFN